LTDNTNTIEQQAKIHQYTSLKADVRDYDKLIWGTPTISAAVTGIVLNLLFSTPEKSFFFVIGVVTIGLTLNIAMFHGMVKHRFFQEHKNALITTLEDELPILKEEKKTSEVYCSEEIKKKNFGWLYRRRAFWSLLTAQVILVISVAAAGIYTLTNNILWTHRGYSSLYLYIARSRRSMIRTFYGRFSNSIENLLRQHGK
jgi:hypothetical protein